jgi:prephenate dehydratase
MAAKPDDLIAFQGLPGAYSDLACRTARPDMKTMPCAAFEDVFAAVHDGKAQFAMIPVENSVAGRVADIHHLLPGSGLHIIGEHFQRVNHQLLVLPGTKIEDLKTVHSHVHALSQCRKFLRQHGLTAVVHADTAGAAKELSEERKPGMGAIASTLAAETYGLEILRDNIEDEEHNTTRFLIMAPDPIDPDPDEGLVVTSFVFRVRNVPAALYKALGGFATNGVNMTKLESYMVQGQFVATQFYADIEGHPDQTSVRLALEELGFFSREVTILGVYPAAPLRVQLSGGN